MIAIYAARKPSGEEDGEGTSFRGTVTDGDTDSFDSGSTVPNLADLIKEHIPDSGIGTPKPVISGNNTGEISYDEIVRRQNDDLDREFRTVISDYNKKYGITTSTPASTTATVSKDYKYFVNKNTKIIHRYDCLLKPVNSADMLGYETIREAEKAGYTERCPVCSP